MSRNRDARQNAKPDDMGVESGHVWFGSKQNPGRAGAKPGKRGSHSSQDRKPAKGFVGSWFGRGPTRGSYAARRDRKGKWMFGGEGRGPKGDE